MSLDTIGGESDAAREYSNANELVSCAIKNTRFDRHHVLVLILLTILRVTSVKDNRRSLRTCCYSSYSGRLGSVLIAQGLKESGT